MQIKTVPPSAKSNCLFFWILTFVVIGIVITGLSGCEQKEEALVIKLEDKKPLEVKKRSSEEKSIRIAIGAMITPKAGFAYYRYLLTYIEEQLGKPIKFIDKKTYQETNALLKSGNVHAAFVCGLPYVDGYDEFKLELLVVPQSYGKTEYYSYLIVPKDSPVKNFKDLQGKRFAFTDPRSNTGKLVPTYLLEKMGQTPDSFFKEYVYTYAHDKSIEAVARKLVDGAAVDSLIWEYLNQRNSELASKTKVIWKSPPYGIPPVVVSSSLDEAIKNQLKEVFLNIHKEEKGREILKGLMIEKFILGDDKAYDSIRTMKAWVKQKANKP